MLALGRVALRSWAKQRANGPTDATGRALRGTPEVFIGPGQLAPACESDFFRCPATCFPLDEYLLNKGATDNLAETQAGHIFTWSIESNHAACGIEHDDQGGDRV